MLSHVCNKLKLSGATSHKGQRLLCSSQYTWTLGTEVNEQMPRSGGQSDELLPQGQTLNYCQQLDRLKLANDQKWSELANRRGAVFHKDSARTHTSVVTRHNLWDLGWEVIPPPYGPDLAPSDYHLFLALQNVLSDKKLVSREDCGNRLLGVFANKSQDFYERGIMKPPLKWQQVIQQNGVYLTQIGQLKVF
ncbi:mariner Mos1 transposase [Trichonephila clavipes]|nr:mariner Mos1 transposase [Trichonephila clavipes]